jgi:hypothetical protein
MYSIQFIAYLRSLQSWEYFSFAGEEALNVSMRLTSDTGVSLYLDLSNPPSLTSAAKIISGSRTLQVGAQP